jgi:Zn finger protein HypA/HybF involved in hydrogenase expression
MHELSLVQSLLDIIEEYRTAESSESERRPAFLRTSRRHRTGGAPFRLRRGLPENAGGRGGPGIRHLPVVVSCLDCGRDSTVDGFTSQCPLCGGGVLVTGGNEELRFLEMDVD